MSVALCPYCRRSTTLPDPWTAPGFTCPHCRAAVTLGLPPPAPLPPADPFADLDEPEPRPVRVHHRNRTRAGEAMRTSFGDAFGGVLGTFAANCLIAVFVGSVVVIGVFAFIHLRRP